MVDEVNEHGILKLAIWAVIFGITQYRKYDTKSILNHQLPSVNGCYNIRIWLDHLSNKVDHLRGLYIYTYMHAHKRVCLA